MRTLSRIHVFLINCVEMNILLRVSISVNVGKLAMFKEMIRQSTLSMLSKPSSARNFPLHWIFFNCRGSGRMVIGVYEEVAGGESVRHHIGFVNGWGHQVLRGGRTLGINANYI